MVFYNFIFPQIILIIYTYLNNPYTENYHTKLEPNYKYFLNVTLFLLTTEKLN